MLAVRKVQPVPGSEPAIADASSTVRQGGVISTSRMPHPRMTATGASKVRPRPLCAALQCSRLCIPARVNAVLKTYARMERGRGEAQRPQHSQLARLSGCFSFIFGARIPLLLVDIRLIPIRPVTAATIPRLGIAPLLLFALTGFFRFFRGICTG